MLKKIKTNITLVAVVIAMLAVAFAFGEKCDADMRVYAAKHNCTWTYPGTLYGDDRDNPICKVNK